MADREDACVPVRQEALEEAIYRWRLYRKAATVEDQSYAFGLLSEAMSDLTSYHPGWDYEHDTMPWDREDEAAEIRDLEKELRNIDSLPPRTSLDDLFCPRCHHAIAIGHTCHADAAGPAPSKGKR